MAFRNGTAFEGGDNALKPQPAHDGLYEEAVRLAARIARGHGGLLAYFRGASADEAPAETAARMTAEAQDAIRRALALDPDEPNARVGLYLLEGRMLDWTARDRQLRGILNTDPGQPSRDDRADDPPSGVGLHEGILDVERANPPGLAVRPRSFGGSRHEIVDPRQDPRIPTMSLIACAGCGPILRFGFIDSLHAVRADRPSARGDGNARQRSSKLGGPERRICGDRPQGARHEAIRPTSRPRALRASKWPGRPRHR